MLRPNKVKVAVLYNLVEKPTDNIPLPQDWGKIIKRFRDSYVGHQAGVSHDLFICSSGTALSASSRGLLHGLKYTAIEYKGSGWDIGAYQYCARRLLAYDLVLFLNSQAFIVQDDWLSYFAAAFKKHGPGIYGSSSSFEVAPHIRTSSFAVSPKLLLRYPLQVRSRYDACVFEHSPTNFSLWALSNNVPVYVVMRSGAYKLLESRQSENIFRRGTQDDLLVNDRHTIIYRLSVGDEREQLEKLADGEIKTEFVYLNGLEHLISRYRTLQAMRRVASSLKGWPKSRRLTNSKL